MKDIFGYKDQFLLINPLRTSCAIIMKLQIAIFISSPNHSWCKNWPIPCTFPSLTGLGSDINVRHFGEACGQQWTPGQDSQRTECIPWEETSLLSKVSSSLSPTCKDCSLPTLDASMMVKGHGISACKILFNTRKQN